MGLNEYQKEAMTTCMATCDNFSYMALNLVGEVGEFASKVAKNIRKGIYQIDENILCYTHKGFKPKLSEKEFIERYHYIKSEEELQKEAGDILWQLSGLCSVMGWKLEDIAQMNLDKLASRKERGVIDGDGDNR